MFPQKLNIKLPRHWDACSAKQLEQIASVIKDETERVTAFHPFSMQDVKTALFFLWSGLRIVEPINPRVKVEDQYYVCRHNDVDGPFNLYLWQIDYWINGVIDYEKAAQQGLLVEDGSPTEPLPKRVKGQLDWLDDPNDTGLINMPYDFLKLRKQSGYFSFFSLHFSFKKTFAAPDALMQNFSWQQYRFAQDLMDNYIKQSNNYVKMNRYRTRFSPEQLIKQEQTVDLARAMFLACIFNAKVRYIDTDTKKAVHGFHYTSNQFSDNAQYFRRFPDEKWQVVLFWWSGMMRYLQKQFPHVFKQSKVKDGSAVQNPLEVYTATIATLEKYLKQTEEELNRKTFMLTLETLERMAKENEEMEKLNKKRK